MDKVKVILKEYYEHMCGVDDYGCAGCLGYEQRLIDYIKTAVLEARIEENNLYVNLNAETEYDAPYQTAIYNVQLMAQMRIKHLKKEENNEQG